MNKENLPDADALRLSNADRYHKEDMALSRAAAEAPSSHDISEGLIHEVENFLANVSGELESEAELTRLLRKLDTAIAISNEPYARELRLELEKSLRKSFTN